METSDACWKLTEADAVDLTFSKSTIRFRDRRRMQPIRLLLHLVFFSELPQLVDHFLFLHRQLLAHQLYLDLHESLLLLLLLELCILFFDLFEGCLLLLKSLVGPQLQDDLLGGSLVLQGNLSQLNIFLLLHLQLLYALFLREYFDFYA